jgi:adenylyltransferase/sulfurtransferase
MNGYGVITVEEVKARLDAGEEFVLIDVREPREFQFCRIEGAQLRPLGQIRQWMQSLDKNAETVVYCHHGMRSDQAAVFLAHNGFTNVRNMIGGIDEWSRRVDAAVPRY